MIRICEFIWKQEVTWVTKGSPNTIQLSWPRVKYGSWGLCLQPGAFWIGAHWSPHNRRLCVNVLPFVTLWVTALGGKAP